MCPAQDANDAGAGLKSKPSSHPSEQPSSSLVLERLELKYSRLEQCLMDLCTRLDRLCSTNQALIEQNAAFLQAMAEQDGDEDGPLTHYLSGEPATL